MAVYHGKAASVYYWNGTSTAHTDENCTESTNTAQITDTTKQILDPNETQTFTDTGLETVTRIDYTIGKAYFTGNVTIVTATGKHCLAANITVVVQAYEWSLESSLELVDVTDFGDTYKANEAGMMSWTGSISTYFYNSNWKDYMDTTKIWFCKFFIDGTHGYKGWCYISGLSQSASVNEVVKENVTVTGWHELTYF